MNSTTHFFSKLKKLAVTLESETSSLQLAFENRNSDGDTEKTARPMRAYHELNCDVGNLKGQIQDQLAQQKAQNNEVSNFIKACRVMEQRVSKDIESLKRHWKNYGYQAPSDSQRSTKPKDQEEEAEDEVEDEDETNSGGEEENEEEESVKNPSSMPPKPELPNIDMLRTPQLSDFGLSDLQLKRALAGGGWCSEVPPMSKMNLPHPPFKASAPSPMPITPKCALQMDDYELQTPQMHDFGITEHTMCLNNDFTMNLFKKKAEKPQRPSQDTTEPAVNTILESLQTKGEKLESPEPPVFCTPGFKIKKTNGHCSPAAQDTADPESPCCPGNLPTTPEVPAFKTPYVNRLVSTQKSTQQPDPSITQTVNDSHTFNLPTPPCNKAAGFKRTWEYDVPDISITGLEDKQMPEMPNLESALGNSLQTSNAKMLKISEKEKLAKQPTVSSLELDGPTQEFSLGTPHIRMHYQEPTTPEMPDLSSVTQDICKLVSQAQLKKTTMTTKHPHVKPEKERHRAASLSEVSESEFQSLPSYLRQMSLYGLNQAVHNINSFIAEYRGETTEFQMEKLRRIIGVGTKAPIYILCLTELKRLKHVRGDRNTSVYKLITHI
ncbi:SKA complex subunit 3 [Archocentrus centrarchus]|uniref:SKA complex subunit 3 n=1 Tax=Archocentrus centrarchus TaxID=63155 RepID=UPI0011EA24CB|nr:spindle and kinetochore-associated protein 3 [Archocentrus centrarchus]